MPESIHKHIGSRTFRVDDIGQSSSSIMLFDDMILKISGKDGESDNEIRMMSWLAGKLPVPNIIASESDGGFNYLLMSKVRGQMSCDDGYMQHPNALMAMMADALKTLWCVDIVGCPNESDLEHKLAAARMRVENGLVDRSDAEPDTYGEKGFKDPAHLLDWLTRNRPDEERVFSHGDFCMPNLFFEGIALSGVIDLGRAGIADRWQDIALCVRSLGHNFAGRYGGKRYDGFDVARLFDCLDIKPDWDKIRYYILLDELF